MDGKCNLIKLSIHKIKKFQYYVDNIGAYIIISNVRRILCQSQKLATCKEGTLSILDTTNNKETHQSKRQSTQLLN